MNTLYQVRPFQFLYRFGDNTYWLDHRLTPEVRAMFAAMTSRMPVDGLEARYQQIVHAVAESSWEQQRNTLLNSKDYKQRGPLATWAQIPDDVKSELYRSAELQLTIYPLHPRVLEFFNQFVRDYGHSSILELVGSPTVYADHLSWWTAYLLFDSPLVCGQENSTRAVTRRDWPPCRESMCEAPSGTVMHPLLETVHDLGMEIANEEIAWWKEHFKDKKMEDAQAFRPALDRARWALPGTISTGISFASHIRERARAFQDAIAFYSGSAEALAVVREIQDAYNEAIPGIARLGLKEAWYEAPDQARIPWHLDGVCTEFVKSLETEKGWCVDLDVGNDEFDATQLPPRERPRTYADPSYNSFRMKVTIQCSLAVTRDWHRHRTLYPFKFRFVEGERTKFRLDHHYEPKSVPHSKVLKYLEQCAYAFDRFVDEEDYGKAMLAAPFGAAVQLKVTCGLRDLLYVMELRQFAHGANFEYKDQAGQVLEILREAMPKVCERLKVSHE